MSALVGDHIHIPRCAIEVGKDKRRAVVIKIRHIAARFFCLSAKDIKQFVLHHKIKKLSGLIGQFLVHFLSSFHDFLRCTLRIGIAILKIHFVVKAHEFFQSQTIFSFLMKLFSKRHKHFFYLLSEVFHLFFSITVSIHAVIAKLYEIFIAKQSCLFRSHLHKPVVNFIQFVGNTLKKGIVFFPCFFTYFSVCVRQVRTQQR